MPIRAYLNGIYRRHPGKMRANSELSKILEIGDIGILEDGVFVHEATLEEKGIAFRVRSGPKEPGKLDLSSERGVKVEPQFRVKGDAKVVELNAEAAFLVKFERANSYVFRAEGVRTEFITNLEAVEKAVIQLYEYDNWNKDHVIITEITIADSVTILISGQAGVTTTLNATGTFGSAL